LRIFWCEEETEFEMIKCVVDSNYLRSEKLREFLAGSPKNIAVLTDYSAMEAHSREPLITVLKSMEIVSEFPHQVVILKSSSSAALLRGRPSGMKKVLIDKEGTKGFPEYCHQLKLAKAGDVRLQRVLLEQGRLSAGQLGLIRFLVGTNDFRDALKDLTNLFSKEELSVIRQKKTFSGAMIGKLASQVVRLAAHGFATHRKISKLPRAEELTNTFLYRYALCSCLLSLRWASHGGAETATSEKLRNDLVDLNFVSFATFFDGLLSDDAKAIDIYEAAKKHLKRDALEVAVRRKYRDFKFTYGEILDDPNLGAMRSGLVYSG
jgi:hypothetical protein